eukprot:CAMPEP_0177600580 /NCGR_PEP_ID=MMETSP0419_2-20121207/13727_1 /TAXON_ID=582737 /ORGANISM="Tetraselmis sp., Strain GSL018" /LENGTH=188 /DNA_ID=CAMNT_0019093639 /DNA_START=559 /DNA_END=1125 /DNA_ORIENTATION=+
MTAAGLSLGEANGHMGIYLELVHSWDLLSGTVYLVPFVGGLVLAVNNAAALESLQEMKESYEQQLVPVLERIPWWGMCSLALSASVGEEVFFRGFLQSALDGALPLGGDAGLAASISITSLVFGALHAITPASFLWATAASVALGIEFHTAGLGSAIWTHWMYDWFAFYFLCKSWGSGRGGGEAPRQE